MSEQIDTSEVRGYLHRPEADPRAAVVLAHGAGSDSKSKLMVSMAEAFAAAGVMALRIDLPFRVRRASGPPHPSTAALDREGLRKAAATVRGTYPFLFCGHSYGGRQASMLAAEDGSAADALLLLSYPLHPPAKPDQLRTSHFPAISKPVYFIHGSRDPFGSADEMRAAVGLIPATHKLQIVDGAAHELKPVIRDAASFVAAFLAFTSVLSRP